MLLSFAASLEVLQNYTLGPDNGANTLDQLRSPMLFDKCLTCAKPPQRSIIATDFLRSATTQRFARTSKFCVCVSPFIGRHSQRLRWSYSIIFGPLHSVASCSLVGSATMSPLPPHLPLLVA